MRAGQLRVLAWSVTFVAAAVVLWTSRQSEHASRPRLHAAARPELPPPGLLPRDAAAAVLPINPDTTAATTGHVIHEPDDFKIRKPELTLSPPNQLKQPTAAATPLPLNVLLQEPRREEAPIGPRVAQDVISEPIAKGPPPTALPNISRGNPAMEPVNAAARQHVIRGFSLGDKAAVYAARTEFIQALRTIAQAIDAQAGLAPKDPQSCSLALVQGLQALTEADDFAPAGSRLDGNLDLTAIIVAHRTPACKSDPPASQLAAMQAYFNFARGELQRAAAANPVASQALTGLGKSYTVAADKNPNRLGSAKAMVFHQAAVGADPQNHLAANELGVLLARHGQWQPAKEAFLQSLRAHNDPATWQNLAAVHHKLGEADLAQLAAKERQLALRQSPRQSVPAIEGTPTVQWVDPKAFAGPPEDALPATPTASTNPPSAARKLK